MSKPRLAVFDFACCEGCQLQIVNMEEALLELLSVVDPVEWREAMSEQSDQYDIAIVEGSITRSEDEERLKEIRKQARILIALGACATLGGVNKIKNLFEMDDVRREVYAEEGSLPHLNTAPTRALSEVVEVDYEIQGCPIDAGELSAVVKSLLAGRKPEVPDYPVCVECKLRENGCRFEKGELCLGPITRAGCGAHCPSNGMWCFGCRGPVSEPNMKAMEATLQHYGRTMEELRDKVMLFCTGQEIKL